ncbi:MAG TPA: hypothetical protein VGM94_08965 [Galbitalea sp.]|jgi:hypothetical protein
MTTSLQLRSDIALLNKRMSADIRKLFHQSSDDTLTALRDLLPSVIDGYGPVAASIAADWYDTYREQAGAPKRFTAIPGDIADSGTQALIGWATATATNDQTFEGFILAGSQRRMANFSRLTVTGSSTADPSARGWQRVGVGECDFCAMLLGRGAVYSEATADFAAHDNCHCGAEPVFD